MSLMKHKFFKDAQSALTFIKNEAEYIETEVEKIEYPEVQYPDLIPVDFSAPEWVKTVSYYSTDRVGKASWFNHLARDVPRADVNRNKFETTVEMAAIGYGYTTEELAQAQMAGVRLETDRADAARESYEEFVDDVALLGDADKGFEGLLDYTGVTATDAIADGNANGGTNQADWLHKSPDQILRDVNSTFTAISLDTKGMGRANTVLLPQAAYEHIATVRIGDNLTDTILDWLLKKNTYTAMTGQPIMVRVVQGLETAGSAGTGRMIVYRRDPRVLKMHIPMRHRFLEPMRTGALIWEVPGIFRLGGLDVKRPKYIRYLDKITDAP